MSTSAVTKEPPTWRERANDKAKAAKLWAQLSHAERWEYYDFDDSNAEYLLEMFGSSYTAGVRNAFAECCNAWVSDPAASSLGGPQAGEGFR